MTLGPVSRETAPDPALLAALFPTGDQPIKRYVDLLGTTAVDRGLIGPREAGRLWSRHVLNCVVVAPLFGTGAKVCDLGSGAGLPGLVLALARPDLRVTLLEPLLRRSTFLVEVVAALGMTSVDVCRGRAEDQPSVGFDYVTARAVAPLDRLARWGLPLVRDGGELVAFKGAGVEAELETAGPALRELRASHATIATYGAGVVSPPTTVVRIGSTGRHREPKGRA